MVKIPAPEQLREISASYDLDLSDAGVGSFLGLVESVMASYDRIDQLAEPAPAEPPVKYPRSGGRRPEPEENPLGAWYYRCSIRGAPEGPLSGKRIAIKDNVCVAGLPMMNGTAVLEGYVPEADATIVTRILDAGGEILGKAVCESLCFSGGSHTSDTGPVLNPHNHSRSAGGSSSGSGGPGGDRRGRDWHRRRPGWLYTNARLLVRRLRPQADPRPRLVHWHLPHRADARSHRPHRRKRRGYRPPALGHRGRGRAGPAPERRRGCRLSRRPRRGRRGDEDRGSSGKLRLAGTLGGGLRRGGPGSVRCVRRARGRGRRGLRPHAPRRDAHMERHSYRRGDRSHGRRQIDGHQLEGHHTTSLLDAYARGRFTRANDLSKTVKLTMLTGRYMQQRYHGRYYAKAQNLSRKLAAAYDAALEDYDLLLLSTVPMKATPIPEPDAPRKEVVQLALEKIHNTCSFDVVGYPSMTVPCGLSEGLPVGAMLVGGSWDEAKILRAARAFEATGSYDAMLREGLKSAG